MTILKMNRPVLFRFKPGQHAFLRVPAIDGHWHPFSIASGPDSSILEFHIKVAAARSLGPTNPGTISLQTRIR
jgi:NAD(P)H-flavin reductase